MANWQQVRRRCDEQKIQSLGFSVGTDQGRPVLLKGDARQAYTPGGAIDVINHDTQQPA